MELSCLLKDVAPEAGTLEIGRNLSGIGEKAARVKVTQHPLRFIVAWLVCVGATEDVKVRVLFDAAVAELTEVAHVERVGDDSIRSYQTARVLAYVRTVVKDTVFEL